MTVLLNCAFDDPAAALVLAHKLNVMPFDRTERARLATSWLVHNIWLGQHPRTYARRSIAAQLLDRKDT
jgi:hypothetical protein